jgi:hypothetical protein
MYGNSNMADSLKGIYAGCLEIFSGQHKSCVVLIDAGYQWNIIVGE